MMGEYILYYRGRVFGGIYDDRLLAKPDSYADLSINMEDYHRIKNEEK